MRDARPNWPNGIGLLIVHAGALLALLPAFFSWQALAVAAILFFATGAFGVTLCYHRTLTHRSLKMRLPVEYATAILGTLAFQGGPIEWVSTHRIHHANSDRKGDPHSVRRGFGWAHVRWLVQPNPNIPRGVECRKYAPDLWEQPFYRILERSSIPLQALLGIGLFFLGGWSWVVWGIFARLVFTYHTTWLVNSAAHTFGYRAFRTKDRSTNSWWVALLTFGEGWHNNHHAFPFSARHGLRWFELDITWWWVKILKLTRLAYDIRVPSRAALERLALPPRRTQGA